MLLFSTHSRDSSQSFRGFDVQDADQSKHCISSIKIELCDIPLPEIPEMDEMHIDSTNDVIEPLPNNAEECNDQTLPEADMNQSDEPEQIVGEILEEVVETIIQDDKVRADSEHKVEATTEVTSQVGVETIPMPKDDPETAFFLSLS